MLRCVASPTVNKLVALTCIHSILKVKIVRFRFSCDEIFQLERRYLFVSIGTMNAIEYNREWESERVNEWNSESEWRWHELVHHFCEIPYKCILDNIAGTYRCQMRVFRKCTSHQNIYILRKVDGILCWWHDALVFINWDTTSHYNILLNDFILRISQTIDEHENFLQTKLSMKYATATCALFIC